MKIIPIASDSLGVRSMATYIETKDCKILIDPSAALAAKRYSLPPHQKEYEALNNIKEKISSYAKKCDILTISHYHFDHYEENKTFYKEKKVFAKSITKKINKSQKERGKELKNNIEKICDLNYCDDSDYKFGNTKILFSSPFFHGPKNVRLGYIIMTEISEGKKRILHTSDVQGPITDNATDYIIERKPDILILDGPPTNLLGYRFSYKNLEKATINLIKIIENIKCDIILDHHLLRDIKYKKVFSKPYEIGKKRVKTFAEYLGKENNTLEANRKKLWGK
jgi:uncharacterized protein